ncbi:MAG: hypothetical protein R2681_03485 [Pyrinomonadaceae bacterium]
MRITTSIINGRILKLLVIGCVCLVFAGIVWSGQRQNSQTDISAVSSGSSKVDIELSRAAFLEAYKVFVSPRCANCHPGGDSPTQGDFLAVHAQNVVRGKDGKGVYGMRCNTCHQSENLPGEKMPPGVANWHMPPEDMKMVFQQRTPKQLCEQLKDPKMNGGRETLEEAVEHLEEDPLVHWAWDPGNGRTTPPISYKAFMESVREWVENGGECPE